MSALTDRIAGVAAARGVPDQAVIDALVRAVKASIAKAYSPDLDVEIGFDADGSLEAYAFKEILPNEQSLTNPHKQIRLADARKSLPDLDIGDEYGQPIDVAALEQKALEPGRLEKLFERYSGNENGNGKRKKQNDTKALMISDVPTSPPALPPRPPVEIIETKPGIYREVPWKDTRSREEIIADLQREVDTWRENMIRQFTDKIDAHAEALKSLIEEQVKC